MNDIRYDCNGVRLREGEYQRKDGNYEFRFTCFAQQQSLYAKTLEDLRSKEYMAMMLADKPVPVSQTLNETFILWKELKRGLRESTFRNYCYLYDSFIRDSLGRMPILMIKKSNVKRFYNYLADSRGIQRGTIDGIQSVLHQVLQIAVNDGWIPNNPADNAIREFMRARNFEQKKPKALSRQEQSLLMTFLSESELYHRWYPIIAVMLGTGMRVGEVTGLRWCDIDLEGRLIDVNHTLVYFDDGAHKMKYAINNTKTPASKRRIPMTDTVRSAFLLEREFQNLLGTTCKMEVDGYTDFVFLNRFGNVHHQGSLNKAVQRIIRDCNDAQFIENETPSVLLPSFSCHSLRHTFISNLVEKNVPMKVIQELAGHADISTTMNIYTHLSDARKAFEMNKLETYCE